MERGEITERERKSKEWQIYDDSYVYKYKLSLSQTHILNHTHTNTITIDHSTNLAWACLVASCGGAYQGDHPCPSAVAYLQQQQQQEEQRSNHSSRAEHSIAMTGKDGENIKIKESEQTVTKRVTIVLLCL